MASLLDTSADVRQFALTHYRESMDRLLETAVYSSKFLKHLHVQLVTTLLRTFDNESLHTSDWQTAKSSLETELKMVALPETLRKNEANLAAAHARHLKITEVSMQVYKANLSPDYDELTGRAKLAAHINARKKAMAFLRQSTTKEPAAFILQWYEDLYDRLKSESPAATPEEDEQLENPGPEPTHASAQELQTSKRIPSIYPRRTIPCTSFYPAIAALGTTNGTTTVMLTINTDAVHIQCQFFESDMPVEWEHVYDKDFFVDQIELEGCRNLSCALQDRISSLDGPDGEVLRQTVLQQWLLGIKMYVKNQCDFSDCSWTVCIDAGMTCAGKRRLSDALKSAGYGSFRIIYKCTAMALKHFNWCQHPQSGEVYDHDILVVRFLADDHQELARFSLKFDGIQMQSIYHLKEAAVLLNMTEIQLSQTRQELPLMKVIVASELPVSGRIEEYIDTLQVLLKSDGSATNEVIFEFVPSYDLNAFPLQNSEDLSSKFTGDCPKLIVTEMLPYSLILQTENKCDTILGLHQPVVKDIVQSFPLPKLVFSIVQRDYDGSTLEVAETAISIKDNCNEPVNLDERKLNIKFDERGILSIAVTDDPLVMLESVHGPSFIDKSGISKFYEE